MTTTEQRLADALRAILPFAERDVGELAYLACDDDSEDEAMDANADVELAREALAAYDAQQAHDVADGAWVAEPITNVVSAPPLPRRAYREPVASCNSAEYAARIVACVNACAGMTTAEVLEFGAPGELGRCAQAWVAEDNDHA